MSHFTTLLILNEYPTQEAIERAMLPFHEYECTGIEDYVVDIDKTDEARSIFEDYLKKDDSNVPTSFEEFVPWYYGVDLNEDGRYIHRTNPNAQWDWYQIGGRWSGTFIPIDPEKACKGRPGLMVSEYNSNGFDIIQKSNIDFESMRLFDINERRKWIDELCLKYSIHSVQLYYLLKDREFVLNEYLELPLPRATSFSEYLTKRSPGNLLHNEYDLPNVDFNKHYNMSEWIEDVPAFTVFSMVVDGKWHQRGKMGWFGTSSDEMDQDDWQTIIDYNIKKASPDSWFIMIDCHI